MKNSRRMIGITVLVAGAALLYGAWAAMRAHRNLVTLDVRQMEVRQVVKKIERQTWETILVHQAVQGRITLQVRNVPLDEVLRIIADQTSARFSLLYPLYSKGTSLTSLKKALRGEWDPATHGWTNLANSVSFRPGSRMGAGAPGGDPDRPQPQLVSLQIQEKNVEFAALALDRFAQARVVPEDGTTATINLTLKQVAVPDAVARLANKARRSWTKLYTLRGETGPRGPFQIAALGTAPTREDPRSTRGGAGETEAQREASREERRALDDELKQTLPPAERERVEQAQQQREQQKEELQALTPEQRRERFAQMGGPGRDQRNLNRIKNTTPEQRVERYQRMDEMRQRMQQRQAATGR